jgi:NADP-dependent 3-hydroxy acid dehydrogenase YdfG
MIQHGSGVVMTVGSGSAHGDDREKRVMQLPYSVTKLGLERLALGIANQFREKKVASSCLLVDEVVVTEAVRLHAPHPAESSIWEAEAIGEAIVWITDQGMDLTARVLGLKELQELGGLKHRRSRAGV